MKITEYESKLSAEMEGKIYEHIWMTYAFGSYMVSKDYYLVENGTIYSFNEGKKQPSGDTLENLMTQCKCIGEYKEGKPYQRKIATYTPEEIKKILNLQ